MIIFRTLFIALVLATHSLSLSAMNQIPVGISDFEKDYLALDGVFLSWTTLLWAAESGHPYIVKALLEVADKLGPGKAWALITLKDMYGTSVLKVAANNDVRNVLEYYRPTQEDSSDQVIQFVDDSLKYIRGTLDVFKL